MVNPAVPGAVRKAAAIIRRGGVVAFPTETVYGVGVDGFSAAAVERLFGIKGRPAAKAIILHLAALQWLQAVSRPVPEVAWTLARSFWPGPLTLVVPRAPAVPAVVGAGGQTVAVRCPAHPLALELIGAVGRAVAATSANRSGRPSPVEASQVVAELDGLVEAVVDGGRTGIGLESTIVDLTASPPVVLRPGGVPVEQLRAFLPDLQVRRVPPGTPDGRLVVVEGEAEPVGAEVVRRARALLAAGRRVAVLATAENLERYDELGGVTARLLGSRGDLEGMARSLFTVLRDLEQVEADVVLAEGLPEAGLGLAINDRLRRAAREVVQVP